jgi:hypothetical protein
MRFRQKQVKQLLGRADIISGCINISKENENTYISSSLAIPLY